MMMMMMAMNGNIVETDDCHNDIMNHDGDDDDDLGLEGSDDGGGEGEGGGEGTGKVEFSLRLNCSVFSPELKITACTFWTKTILKLKGKSFTHPSNIK